MSEPLKVVPQWTGYREVIQDDTPAALPEDITQGNIEEMAHTIQAQSEGVDVTDHVTAVWGKSYPIGDRIGLMPLMRFAHAAKKGMDTGDMEALAAIYDMLKDCIHPDHWERFELESTEARADAEQMMPIVGEVIAMLAARPTQQPTDSSSGQSKTTRGLTDTSSGKAEAMGLVPVSELLG